MKKFTKKRFIKRRSHKRRFSRKRRIPRNKFTNFRSRLLVRNQTNVLAANATAAANNVTWFGYNPVAGSVGYAA